MMEGHHYKVGILTVSDRCSRGEAEDLSGPNLTSIVTSSQCAGVKNVKEIVTKCVPDDIQAIQEVLACWCDQYKLLLVLTTGGTGFSPRDVTPEATRPLLDKEAGGMATAMLVGSLAVTPMAMLSRSVCGVRKSTLVINLPGSKKGSQECLDMLVPALRHAIDLLQNNTSRAEETHARMQDSRPSSGTSQALGGAAHHHHSSSSAGGCRKHHNNNDTLPSFTGSGVARRMRKSPYPMVHMDEAMAMVYSHAVAKPLTVPTTISNAMNRVLGEDVNSPVALPPFPASIKDGYAVLASDGAGERQVLCPVTAGEDVSAIKTISSGKVCRITTGAPVPPGADAVVQVENTDLVKTTEDGSEEAVVNILTAVEAGHDIRPVGSDIALGQPLLARGDVIGPSEVGLLAAVGITEVQTVVLPRVAVLSTGNELADPSAVALKPGQVYDSNRSTLLAVLKEQGFPAIDMGIIMDSREKMVEKLTKTFDMADVLVTSGGVSMGEMDLLKPVLVENFKANLHFGRVFLKPGKPTTFATLEWKNSKKLVFALPGNPVSATVTFYIFVLPALRKMSGRKNFKLKETSAKISYPISLDPRPEFQRAHLSWVKERGVYMATSTGSQCSSRLLSMKTANALLVLPARTDSQPQLPAGSLVNTLLIPGTW